MTEPEKLVGRIMWSAFVSNDGSGCYSSPRRVKVVRVANTIAHVQEKTSYGWSSWKAMRLIDNLFESERDAWAYLAGKFPRDGLGGYFSGIVERMDAEKPTPRPANKQRKEGE